MRYILNSLKFTKEHPLLTLLYLLITSYSLPIYMVTQFQKMGKMQIPYFGLILIGMLFLLFILIYILAGLYASIWRIYLGKGISYKSFADDAKRYYLTIIKVGICLGLLGIIFFIPIGVHMRFYSGVSPTEYGKTIEANLVRNISFLFYGFLFVYAFPFIYVFDDRKVNVIKKSLKFFKKNLAASLPVISLITLSSLLKGIITQIAVHYDYHSAKYWSLQGLNSLTVNYLAIVTFLCAAQILQHYNKQEESSPKI